MSAPEWSALELIDLHRSFAGLLRNTSSLERRDLAFRLILLPASATRLQMACQATCKSRPDLTTWLDDVHNEAQLQLVNWLSADSLIYVESSIEEFGSWYWTLCRRACRRAVNKFHNTSRALAFIDPEYLTQCPESRLSGEHPCDRLSRAIGRLPVGPQQDVIRDWESGLTVKESASRRGIPARTVDWLRQRGRQLVFEMYAGVAGTNGD